MANNLDMSLDDLIKSNKSSSSSRSGAAPPRRFDNRAANRAAPYSMPTAPDTLWKHDMFGNRGSYGGGGRGGRRGGESSIETGTKLYISNLDYGVSTDDVKELFSEVGDLKRYTVHYDRSGRSKGTAEVVYSRRNDALAAVKRYNNVELDGKPIKIEIVGTNISSARAPPPASNGFPRNPLGYDIIHTAPCHPAPCHRGDEGEEVQWGVRAVGVVLAKAVGEEETVMKRYLQRI
ncbi:THO complex subunit 4B-like isoform X2 [Silene latifolia]|uniref:THO complex subunit 4B-like isoform X2 n=1 Tax=Silene latifolia TaxID=37657 RepID=UPI003D783068